MKCEHCGEEVRPEIEQVMAILSGVAEEHMVPVEAIRGRGRMQYVVKARNCAARRLREEMYLPLKVIGFYLGGRHHATILYAIRQDELEETA